MSRLKQIETFVSVASRGSLTAAATAEGVAPGVVSRRLDALEARLGVKLLLRTTRRVTLTFEGSAYLEDCQRIQAPAHHPRRHPLGRRRRGQAAAAGHGDEGFDLLQTAHAIFAYIATMI